MLKKAIIFLILNYYSHAVILFFECHSKEITTFCSSADVFLSQHHELRARHYEFHGHYQQLHQPEPSYSLPRYEHGLPQLQPQQLPVGLHEFRTRPHVPLPGGLLAQRRAPDPAQHGTSTLTGLLATLPEHGPVHDSTRLPNHCLSEPGRAQGDPP